MNNDLREKAIKRCLEHYIDIEKIVEPTYDPKNNFKMGELLGFQIKLSSLEQRLDELMDFFDLTEKEILGSRYKEFKKKWKQREKKNKEIEKDNEKYLEERAKKSPFIRKFLDRKKRLEKEVKSK